MMIFTTFALLHAERACPEGYRKLAAHLGGVRSYGQNTPIPLTTILDSNGLDDTLWVLDHATIEDALRVRRLLACDYAEHVLPIYERQYPGDNRLRRAIETSRRYADGLATDEEMDVVWSAAPVVVWSVVWSVAPAAAWRVARSAVRAVWARAEEHRWQEQKFREMVK